MIGTLCKKLPLFLSITLVAQWIVVPSDAFTVSTRVLHSNNRFVKTRKYDPQCLWKTTASFRLLATRAEENNLAPNAKKSPQADIVGKYRSGKYLFGLLGAFLLFMPDRTFRVMLASKVGGAAGFGLAAGLCHILQGAAQHNRLNSDTYKRLNLGLLSFSLLGLVAVPGEAGFLPTASSAMILSAIMLVLRGYGAAVAWKGWRLGMEPINGGSANLWRELTQGMKDGVKDLRVRDPKKALAYRNCLLLVFAGIISNIMDTIFNMRYLNTFEKSLFEVSLKWSAVSRLFLISTMVFSLKDAAERDRLTGTTFIQMNVMVGLWAISVGLGQSLYPIGFAAKRGVEMYAFAIPFMTKALKSQKEKTRKNQQSTPS